MKVHFWVFFAKFLGVFCGVFLSFGFFPRCLFGFFSVHGWVGAASINPPPTDGPTDGGDGVVVPGATAQRSALASVLR